eukprot:TRINITY_DN5607_c0_g2_i1.p1 TRINITY_DN5607_c0_g2~~TRINITY_DN5607_c0_g2_i1.p1  ORF type:complete len:137 (+),score=5.85 TRINITY_DN5607_c0_g2_i1:527-937(+)
MVDRWCFIMSHANWTLILQGPHGKMVQHVHPTVTNLSLSSCCLHADLAHPLYNDMVNKWCFIRSHANCTFILQTSYRKMIQNVHPTVVNFPLSPCYLHADFAHPLHNIFLQTETCHCISFWISMTSHVPAKISQHY